MTKKTPIASQRAGSGLRSSAPSPIGGWNTRDSQALMDISDAVIMDNWFPGLGKVSTRKGYTPYITNVLSGRVETFLNYSANTVEKFLCANNNEINDITSGTPVNLKTGYSNARWQYVNFNAYIVAVNGADTPQTFDGAVIADSTISGSGLVPSELDGINVYKNRIYVWSSKSQDVWYGATNAIGGTFTKFQLSRVAPQGGNLTSMVTWNLDGSTSVTNYAMFLMSSGDVILYQGSDPGTDFVLVGTYKIGQPLAIRGALRVAGDVLIITNQDFVFFSEVYKNQEAILSQSKLSGAAISAAQLYSENYGWEVVNYSKGGYLFFNIPVSPNSVYHQYVINTVTGAACRFTGMNANTWGVFKNNLYFGGAGGIYKADDGLNDNTTEIACDVQASYNTFESSKEKRCNGFRNVLKCDGSLNIKATVNFDYGDSSITETTVLENEGSYWDVSYWDVSYWSPENQLNNKMVLSGGQGTALGMRLKVNVRGQQLNWIRTDYNLTLSKVM